MAASHSILCGINVFNEAIYPVRFIDILQLAAGIIIRDLKVLIQCVAQTIKKAIQILSFQPIYELCSSMHEIM